MSVGIVMLGKLNAKCSVLSFEETELTVLVQCSCDAIGILQLTEVCWIRRRHSDWWDEKALESRGTVELNSNWVQEQAETG